jgi:hypothetical protein
MASGPIITITGGFNMQQVVTGDVISIADFNDARNNVNRLLGAPNDIALGTYVASNTWGYNFGGVGVGAAVTGQEILATGAAGAFKELQDDVQALCAFLGVSLRAGVGVDVARGDTITAQTWNNLLLNVEDCWNDRFGITGRTVATLGTTTFITPWTNTLTQETTWNFVNETNCRAFFNSNSYIGMSASRTGGTANDQNTAWTTLLSNLGAVWLTINNSLSSAGTSSGIGFYELTTSYQDLITYNGPTSPYTGDSIVISGRVNSITNPTQVFIQTVMTDGGDGGIDESPDGTMTFNATRAIANPNGSGFTVFAPTPSVGGVTGS